MPFSTHRSRAGRRLTLRAAMPFLLCQCIAPAAAQVDASPFVVHAISEREWTVAYSPPARRSTSVSLNGIAYAVFDGTTDRDAPPGTPELPIDILTFGIPSGMSLHAEVVRAEYAPDTMMLIAPAPSLQRGPDSLIRVVRSADPRAYAREAILPGEAVRVAAPVTLRRQRIGTITMFPYHYNPATRHVRRMLSATMRVRLDGSPSLPPTSPGNDPAFEPLYRNLLCNYEQARHWRLPSPQADLRDSTRDWFEPGRTYCRIPITTDGWYRVPHHRLLSAGAQQADPASFRIFWHGTEIPIVVRPDTSVEYFGWKDRAYWLSWGGAPGRRYVAAVEPQGVATINDSSAWTITHAEQNTGYYSGTTEEEVIDTDEVPGEGWYWERLFPNSTRTLPFQLDLPDTAPHRAGIRIRLVSMTPDSPGVDHRARFWVNDSLLGELSFDGRTTPVFTDSIPAAWLRDGANSLRVSSLPTSSFPNLFAVDWVEIGYRRRLITRNGNCIFSAGGEGGVGAFHASGCAGTAAEVYDLTGGRLLVTRVTGEDTLSFRDSLSLRRTYLVQRRDSVRDVPDIVPTVFTDLRADQSGADDIIISHPGFLNAARRLAALRAGEGGRVKAVSTQDLYDQFSFGEEDPVAIRRFLAHTLEHWPAPAPAWVTLFGDATWDPHRNLGTSIALDFVPSHGVPVSDDWFVTSDSSIVPFMCIGRIPVHDSTEAGLFVDKMVSLRSEPVGLWNKSMLMITGGDSEGEQETFNARTETAIATYLAPPPIGASVARVYKSSTAVIDTSHREEIRTLLHEGLSFVNFTGHSGTRTWNVDIGDPSTAGSEEGRLPFIASVSCNIAAFAEPSGNVMGEDLVLADGRGASAVWASSSLGYALSGTQMVNFLLSAVRDDTVRDLGRLTTFARIRLFMTGSTDPITRAMVRLNPLLGDPLAQLAVPVRPDLTPGNEGPRVRRIPGSHAPASFQLTVPLFNYGLVPGESTAVRVTDTFRGSTRLVFDGHARPTVHRDSLVIPWSAAVGLHTLAVTLDPENTIAESDETNNSMTAPYLARSRGPAPLAPLNTQVVHAGEVDLALALPSDAGTANTAFVFEVDTTADFSSPAAIRSAPVTPGRFTCSWQTPPLSVNSIHFWRATSQDADSAERSSAEGVFSVADDVPAPPAVRFRRNRAWLFAQDTLLGLAASDSGVTVSRAGALSGSGMVLPPWLPSSTRLDTLAWHATINAPASGLRVFLIAALRSGGIDTIFTSADADGAVSLASENALLDPSRHAGVRPVFLLFPSDTLTGPVLRQWSLTAAPPGDVALSLTGPADTTVARGSPFRFRFGTAASSSFGGIPLAIRSTDRAGVDHELRASVIDSLGPSGARDVEFLIPTDNLPAYSVISASVWSGMAGRDLVTDNNIVSVILNVAGPRADPVGLYADGRRIAEGDYVPSRPLITVALPAAGDPPLVVTGVDLRVDGLPAPAEPLPDDPYRFNPYMAEGLHAFEVSVFREGNGGRDTLRLPLRVYVAHRMRLLQAYPYPSPFSDATSFVFMLSGDEVPEEVAVRIFTVSGRRIRLMTAQGGSVGVGFNRIEWDGRDADGDAVANGVYFYQISVKGRDGTVETVTGKVARVR